MNVILLIINFLYFNLNTQAYELNVINYGIYGSNDEHLKRITQNPNLQYILDLRQRYEIQKNKDEISLNLINRKLEKKERQSWALDTENKRRASLNLDIFSSYEAMKDFKDAEKTDDDAKDIEIDIENDYLLNEGTEILIDYTIFNKNTYLSKAA